MDQNILVGGVETFSAVDYPEHLAAVVFMQGCPWRCPFCYNSALQPVGQPTAFLWEKFIEFLNNRRGILDAVVFSGGEPLVQNNLPQAMEQVRALGYKIGLHTGGYRPQQLALVLPLVDWIGFDIKAPLENDYYARATTPGAGSSSPSTPSQPASSAYILPKVLESLDLILASGKPFECRTTCDPRLLTTEALVKIATALQARGVKSYFLQKYRPIESDMVTTDADCENIFGGSERIAQFKAMFDQFDIRR